MEESNRLPRKLAAILYADVAGYSRLTGEDEEGTHRVLSAYLDVISEVITSHHGQVVHYAGDAVLADFPTATDALRCAITIQVDLKERNKDLPEEAKVQFRIGVNLGEVISDRDDIYGDGVNIAARLESLTEAGGICISESVYTAVGTKLPMDYEFIGEQQVKNIAKPVRAYRVLLEPGAARTGAPKGKLSLPTWVALCVTAVLLAGVSLVAWWQPWQPTGEPASIERMVSSLPDKPSIAVLPFTNMSGDPEQEYFVDGITEDLTTDLSKISNLFVIARNSAFTYKGKAIKPEDVARELGVRYIVEGSVRRGGDQVRINAQLIDASTGGHLWAERYDGNLADVFALQDRVTQKIVLALAVALAPEEKVKHTRETDSPQAYDAFLRGWEHYQLRTPEHYEKAREYFEQAIEFDPDYSRAFAALASLYWKGFYEGWWPGVLKGALEESPAIIQAKGLTHPHYGAYPRAKEYLAAATMNSPPPLAHQVAAYMHLWRGRHEEALEEAQRAIALEVNDADSHVALAEILIFSGKPQDALDSIKYARRLDPHNEARHSYLSGLVEFGMEQYEAAAVSFQKAMELNPELLSFREDLGGSSCLPCTPLAAAYAYLGRKQETRALIQEMRQQRNTANVNYEMLWWPYKETADRDRLAEGLLKAGLPATLSDVQ